MCKSLLHLEPDWSAARKAETLQTFLGKHYFDGNGLMYSMMYWKGWREGADPRPFTMEDFDGYAYLKTSDGFTPRGHANYENSSWTAGHFLTSQCLRYRATGEEQALEYAARAFKSIDTMFKLTEAEGHRGFVCKPYDGRCTVNTSVDQFGAVALGLWRYRDLAPRAARRRIDDLLPAMADWWRERDYAMVFFDTPVKRLDLNVRANLTYTSMNLMAYLITGCAVYQREALRLAGLVSDLATTADELRDKLSFSEEVRDEADRVLVTRASPVFRDEELRGATWLAAHFLPFLFEHDMLRAPLFRHALSRYWAYMSG